MIVKKFNNINEDSNNEYKYHIFVITSAYENYPSIYLFDDYNKAFSFLKNKIYRINKDNEHLLDCFDNIDNIEDLINEYDETNKTVKSIYYSNDNIINDVKLDDWIYMRKNLKKYNL